MIQVPDEIKELYAQDSIAKNFRVHFPNGEHRDLVNDDIVSESVVFTESVSSNTGLKFGLCEGASLEFQTYYNVNIRNLQIQAGIEIDVSSLLNEIDDYVIELEYNSQSMPYIAPYTGTYYFKGLVPGPDFPLTKYLQANEEVNLAVMINQDDASVNPVSIHVTLYKDVNTENMNIKQSSDVPYPYYYIPYGIFYVDSCKRDGHNNIRSVVAYQNKWDIFGNSEFIKISEDEKAKMRTGLYYASADQVQDYSVDILKFLCSCLNSTNILGDNVDKEWLSTKEIKMPSLSHINNHDKEQVLLKFKPYNMPVSEVKLVAHFYNAYFEIYKDIGYYSDSTLTDIEDLHEITYTNSIDMINEIKGAVLEYIKGNPFFPVTPQETDEELLAHYAPFLNNLYESAYPYFEIENRVRANSSRAILDTQSGSLKNKINIENNSISFLIYPYMSQYYDLVISQTQNAAYIIVPKYIKLYEEIKMTDGTITRTDYDVHEINEISNCKAYKYNITSGYSLTLPRKYDKSLTFTTTDDTPIYSAKYAAEDTEAKYLDIKTISDSLVELSGGFLKLNRFSDEFEVINLIGRKGVYPSPDLYPMPRTPEDEALYPQAPLHVVTRSLWRNVWYDDKLSNGYDKVCCNWQNPDGETIYKEQNIVDVDSSNYYERDYQHYDISSNYFIANRGILTEEQVDNILTNLAKVLKDVQYYVSDIEMRGLPYLEAGDSVSVVTKDSGFSTFALRHRISGVQALIDNIEAR